MRILDVPSARGRAEFLAGVARSARLHRGVADPPRTPAAFSAYLRRLRRPNHLGYWVRTPDGELAGVVNVSEIVRGPFQSAYLGYQAFSPHDGRGYMFQGLRAVIREAFVVHRLHRLEANIQPENGRSQSLVRRLGFRREGYSPRYLKVRGRWRDHERWALTIEDWRSGAAAAELTEANVVIRPARESDADAVGALAAEFQAYLRDLGDRTDFAWGAKEFLRDGFGERAAFAGVVAEVDGAVVGYALYHDGYETDRGRRLVHLIDLYVQKDARRRGVGRALMQRVAELGRERGADIVFWSVYKPNVLASAFYERLGARYAATDLNWMSLDL